MYRLPMAGGAGGLRLGPITKFDPIPLGDSFNSADHVSRLLAWLMRQSPPNRVDASVSRRVDASMTAEA